MWRRSYGGRGTQMVGPVDPSLIMPNARLPKPKSFEHWRNRMVCKLLGRLSDEDFNFGFDTVVEWMAAGGGRRIDIAQARYSAGDIILSTCGVLPLVAIQRCEVTGTTLMTIEVRGPEGEAVNRRTRMIELRDPQAEPAPDAIPIGKRKRA